MSLISAIEISNFLNSTRSKIWAPDILLERLTTFGQSTMLQAPNGTCKTSLSEGIFACLTRKKDLMEKTKSRMSTAKVMSHIRIEFVRPLAASVDHSLPMGQEVPVVGENWVVGVCGYNSKDPLIYYYYKGTLDDVPLGVRGRKIVLRPDAEIEEAVKAAPRGSFNASPTEWKEFISHHIPARQLRLLETFVMRGAGDKNAPLFPVSVKPGERYDQAFFYQHIVSLLMEGLHLDLDEEQAEKETTFEQTIVESCRKLVKSKKDLEQTNALIEIDKLLSEEITILSGYVEQVDETEREYQKALDNISGAGAVLAAIVESAPPGFPRMVPHSDPEVNVVLQHMAVIPGHGGCLRAPGLDALMGWGNDKTTILLSKNKLRGIKNSQPIEFIGQESRAKNQIGTGTGRFFARGDAVSFLQGLSDEALSRAKMPRERAIEVLEQAFDHFDRRMDTSPQREALRDLASQEQAILDELDKIEKNVTAANAEISSLETARSAMDACRAAWEGMKSSGLFTEVELQSPESTKLALDEEMKNLDRQISELSVAIGGLSSTQEDIQRFREEYPDKTPLEVRDSLQVAIQQAERSLKRLRAAVEDLGANKQCMTSLKGDAEEELQAAKIQLGQSEAALQALGVVTEAFPGMTAEQASSEIDRQEENLRGTLQTAEDTLRTACETHATGLRNARRWKKEIETWAEDELFGLSRSVDDLRDMEDGLQHLAKFGKRFGQDADVQAIKTQREARLPQVRILLNDLNTQMVNCERTMRLLEEKRVAPGDISARAMEAIPAEVPFRQLFEVVEAAGLPGETRVQVLKTLSSLLFAPVVETVDEAKAVSDALETAGYPIPVFLRQGLEKALQQGVGEGLWQGLYGHMSKMVDILLHPEKIEQAKREAQDQHDRLEKNIEAATAEKEDLEPKSEASQCVTKAYKATLLECAKKSRELLSELNRQRTSAYGALACAGIAADSVAGLPVFPEERCSREYLLVVLGAEMPADMAQVENSEEISSDTVAIRASLDSLLAELDAAFQAEEESFKGRKAALENQQTVCSAAVDTFVQKYRKPPFANALIKALEYDEGKHAKERSKVDDLKIQVEALGVFLGDIERLKDRMSDSISEEDLSRQQTEIIMKSYKFEAMDVFINTGKGKELDGLTAKRAELIINREDLQPRLAFQFGTAQEYIPKKEQDAKALARLSVLRRDLDRLAKQKTDQETCQRNLDKRATTLRDLARDYDGHLASIQGEMKKASMLLEEFLGERRAQSCAEAEAVRSDLAEIVQGKYAPDSTALVNAMGEVDAVLLNFGAEHKVGRARTAKNKRQDALKAFGQACDRFVRERQGKAPEVYLRDVAAAKDEPALIAAIRDNLIRNIKDKQEKYDWTKETHDELWRLQTGRMVKMSQRAKKAFMMLNRVCRQHEDGATFIFEADVASEEVIEKLIIQIRDRVEVQEEKDRLDLARNVVTEEYLKSKRHVARFEEDIRDLYYKTFFSRPTIKFHHPMIAGGQVVEYKEDFLSGGQRVALQLLMVVRLAEFSKVRDHVKATGGRGRKGLYQGEDSFILLDGMLSSLSDDELIKESLGALAACRGVFQIIGLIHNKGYINNTTIFPRYYVVRAWSRSQTDTSSGRWVRMARIGEGGQPIFDEGQGNLAFWHAHVEPEAGPEEIKEAVS
jgi:hypothetical protein